MRKKDHIRLALADKTALTSLDAYAIDYNSVPRFGLDSLDTSTTIVIKNGNFLSLSTR